jgi:uncharacterized protein YpmS
MENRMKNRKNILLILFLMITLISTACKISLGGNEPTAEPIPVSAEAAESVQTIIDSAIITDEQTKSIAFTVTQEQVTSLAAQELANRPEANISNPQIYLQDGKIDVYAVYTQQYFDLNIHLVLTAEIDANNQLAVKIETADLGNVPAPESMLAAISSLLDDTITKSLLPATTGFRMESIYIADGMATISGTVTQ